jgi:hypothetical protein
MQIADKAEITLIKGKLEDIELPVKSVDIIISEVSCSQCRVQDPVEGSKCTAADA